MNVTKILLGVAGLAVVITLIAVPTALFLNEKKVDSRRTFTLQDYFNSSIKARSYNLLWLSDGEYLHKTQEGAVLLFNVSSEKGQEFLSRQTFDQVEAFDYMVSADRQFVCFLSNYSKIWRHSFTASYSIYNQETGFITADIPQEIQYLAWSPTGHKLAFVWKYNVYVKASPNSPLQQVTTDGQMNVILNGIPDWVYEEEMFSSNYALWWSPTGKYLAFAKFNDTNVHTIEYPWYGEGQYPETIYIPYPKSGTPNPTVRLLVVDTANVSNITEVVVPSALRARDHYLSTVTWVTDERIAVQWQNRTQSYVILQMYELEGATWRETIERNLMSQTGWVGRFSPIEPVFRPDGSSYYLIMSDAKGFKHLHHISEDTATPITSGKWEVTNILKVTKDAVYYESNEHNGQPGQRNVYKISIEGSNYSQRVCLTCTLMEDRCKYNSAYFSHDGTYYRMGCSGPGLPLYTLRDSRGAGSEVRVLEDNTNLDSILQGIAMPTVTHGTLKIGEFELWYQMTLPPNLDKSKKYPLLIDVYAGPCSQKSDFRFQTSWSTYLASTENIIVASFDGRGSGFQGDDIMHAIYRHLGTYEVEDQITAARHLIDLGYIDKNKIAIWGWSYGGYVTSMVLGAGSGVFKCGMAVAPVSKWEYYDSIYTERYMLTPSENQALYDNSTVTSRAKNFKSVQYLLVHGTADDNVHFQQAAQISKALVDQQIDFDSMWYTDKDHGLGGSANQHVYTHLSHFLKDCFA
ncbi:dipeptidyl peptidase 4 isoform X2 [Electrophorus electricus]|uniref:dipeptidyl peptidase 4 isoform X2 n=1 Tax=Electrophorus electricus TaxID=8005 RepID=UPI0015D01DDA|nr:dipeptidyl peptidase 4 isoform X2 [Electrophorus electricus]